MRIVDIELDRSEEILHPIVLDVAAVDEVLILAPDDDLPGDGDLVVVLVPQRRLLLVAVVEGDGDGGLRDARLTILVDQLLQVGRPDVAQVGDTEEETDGVQDITFSRPNNKHHDQTTAIFKDISDIYPFRPVIALNW